jgi:hypothetical protein
LMDTGIIMCCAHSMLANSDMQCSNGRPRARITRRRK